MLTDVAPAFNLISPPAVELDVPVLIEIAPALPRALPEEISIPPEDDEEEEPLDSVILPLSPLAPPLSVEIETAPLVPDELAPLNTDTSPPLPVVAVPATTERSDPTPVFEVPTFNSISPADSVDAPDERTIDPDLEFVDVPVVAEKLPLAPEAVVSPDFNSTEPEEANVEPPLCNVIEPPT